MSADGTEDRLELFFSQSLDGFFFMRLHEPIAWNDRADKEALLDYGSTGPRRISSSASHRGHFSRHIVLLPATGSDFVGCDDTRRQDACSNAHPWVHTVICGISLIEGPITPPLSEGL